MHALNKRIRSVCPHDCPSVCALDVEVIDQHTIGKVYGAKDHSYTQGVICAKVSRYAERVHHPERILRPLRRKAGRAKSLLTGAHSGNLADRGSSRGSGGVSDNGSADGSPEASEWEHSNTLADIFEPISWDDALDTICDRFESIRKRSGAEAIWPFHYAGTMGLVQRDGLQRFRRAYGTSRQHSTYCVAISDAGFLAGAGTKSGSDVRLMSSSELIVVWGGNPVSTQVNVMSHLAQARRLNSAKFVVIDPYRTKTADKADMHLMLKPGTDGALACAVMHVMLKEGLADHAYMAKYTAKAEEFIAHLETRTPEWAARITGLPIEQILEFARLYGRTKKSFLRLGYGFTRSRNGAVSMHAVSCLPAVSGAWQYEGGGALYGNSSIYPLDCTQIQGLDIACNTRLMDQSRIGQVLTGNPQDLQGGPAIEALFIQNTNPAVVAPETRVVLQGLAREDLFTVVHEQFMTETAQYADIILPATMFLEHDDIYTASGHTHLQIGRKLIEPPGQCRSNHWVLQALAKRLGLKHEGFEISERELIEQTLSASGLPGFDALLQSGGLDCAHPTFEDANFLNGFGTPDRKFHFAPDWSTVGPHAEGMPAFPDHWDVIDTVDEQHPLRLVAAPARQFLNTSFSETASSRRMEKQPHAKLHPEDLQRFGLVNGELITLGNRQGEVSLRVIAFDGVQQGTVIVEGLWSNRDFPGALGINTLISSQPAQPNGGAVFHDTAVWARLAKKVSTPAP